MILDINDLIYFHRQKNGIIKFKYNLTNQGNIYKLLRSLGYGKSKIKNKLVFFHRRNNNIKAISLCDIHYEFKNFLQTVELTNLPEGISRNDILEWYLSTQPIKQNNLFAHYMHTN